MWPFRKATIYNQCLGHFLSLLRLPYLHTNEQVQTNCGESLSSSIISAVVVVVDDSNVWKHSHRKRN